MADATVAPEDTAEEIAEDDLAHAAMPEAEAVPVPPRRRESPWPRRIRTVVLALCGVVLVVLAWEAYKVFWNATDGSVLGWDLPASGDNTSMPHSWDVLSRFTEAEQRGSSRTVGMAVLSGAWFTLRLAFGGFLIGLVVGMLLALVMQRFRVVERGLLPLVILSQTIPLVALAPLVAGWGGNITLPVLGDWRPWMSVVVIAAYLAFFPVAVGALRGLQSPSAASEELMRSYAAGYWATLRRLRLPASVPYLVPALKLAAAAAVVGAIVAEISTGTPGGIGRLIIEYSREATSDPAKVYTAMLAAAALGLVVAGIISAFDSVAMRNRPKEERGVTSESTAGATTVGASPEAGAAPTPPVAVEVREVSKTFERGRSGQVDALAQVSLSITPGEFVSLIGPSGCGKSTLLRLIADLTHPTAGTILVNGKPAAKARTDQDYAMAFQQSGLFEWRTVAKNIELPLELQGWSKAKRRERSRELLELIKLPDVADHYPWELSGGMQQRVAIARALALDPNLLLMDEPFGALDEMTREHMQAELERIRAATEKTIVFVTHSIPEAVYLSDRVVVMSARPGRITKVVDVVLGERTDETRESTRFFEKITEVREALRGVEMDAAARGIEDR